MQRGALNHAHVHGQDCSRHALPSCSCSSCLPAVPFSAPWGATAAAAAVRHTKKNSKPKRRQQNNFILFSGGKQSAGSREGARGEGQKRGAAEVATRGTWNCSCGASLTSLRCKCVHNAAKFRECKQKRPKAQWQLCRRVAFASSCLSFIYSFDNLHLKEL